MNCDATRKFVHAYADGELDLVRSLEIEEHLEGCAACSQVLRNVQALKSTLHHEALYFRPPAHLQARVLVSIREAGNPKPAYRRWPLGMLSLAAALVLGVALVWLVARSFSTGAGASAEDALAQSVVASHVRSMMAGHLSDVVSSDKHTVKPWFDGKIDYSPPVEDLAPQGFPLQGGRLDYIDNRPVAALVYGRQKHIINLFIWPTGTSGSSGFSGATGQIAEAPPSTIQGYNVIHWTESSMTFWAVSDLNSTELQQFVQLVRSGAH